MKHWSDLDISHLVFTHIDPDTGKNVTIDVTALSADRRVKMRPKVLVPLDYDWAAQSIKDRGIEKHRIDRLLPLKQFDPVLFCFWGDGTHVLVDGNHRYVARAVQGHRDILARTVPLSVWREYQVLGFPDEDGTKLSQSFSGIL